MSRRKISKRNTTPLEYFLIISNVILVMLVLITGFNFLAKNFINARFIMNSTDKITLTIFIVSIFYIVLTMFYFRNKKFFQKISDVKGFFAKSKILTQYFFNTIIFVLLILLVVICQKENVNRYASSWLTSNMSWLTNYFKERTISFIFTMSFISLIVFMVVIYFTKLIIAKIQKIKDDQIKETTEKKKSVGAIIIRVLVIIGIFVIFTFALSSNSNLKLLENLSESLPEVMEYFILRKLAAISWVFTLLAAITYVVIWFINGFKEQNVEYLITNNPANSEEEAYFVDNSVHQSENLQVSYKKLTRIVIINKNIRLYYSSVQNFEKQKNLQKRLIFNGLQIEIPLVIKSTDEINVKGSQIIIKRNGDAK